MCGFTGIFSSELNRENAYNIAEKMLPFIDHRGPDGFGVYSEPDNIGMSLGHKRLAIIDPGFAAQPMTTQDGNITIVFNGAIYNYPELREELIKLGHPIQHHSDTEVLLYSYRQWGEACLDKLRGMFAFAIWDRNKKQLFCARDRIGIKPFYFYFDTEHFIFASEIKAILASGLVKARADYNAIQDYLTFQFCLGEKTLFRDINKLEPGYFAIAKLRNGKLELKKQLYWDIAYEVDDNHDETYFIDKLKFLLEDSVKEHLRADVPLGAHLSGGLDSSTVVCLAKSQLGSRVFKTFTGAFSEGRQFDETAYARLVAEKCGTQHHEIFIPSNEFPRVLPKLVYFMDEPAAGPGLIPQYYVSKLASEHVKVVLGGQGGDELYMGYARYLVAYLEQSLRVAIEQPKQTDKYHVSLEKLVPNLSLLKTYKPMLQQLWRSGLFEAEDSRYFRLTDRAENSKYLYNPEIFQNYSSFSAFQRVFNKIPDASLINKMSYFDLKASLPALLHVEDRTSMSVSLESRVPLLDHRLVELIASVPPNIKFANGKTKHLFREAIKNIIPEAILNRKDKMGFPVPLNQWAQKEHASFVHDILLSDRARDRGIYNADGILSALAQADTFGRSVWGLLNMELWFRTFIDGDAFKYE